MEIIENAKIESTMLGIEDHGIMTYFLYTESESYSQGFGGFGMDEPYKEKGKFVERRGSAYGTESIKKILEAIGVDKWEDLKGKYIRIRRDNDRLGGKIIGIGHITKNQWFFPEDLRERYYPEED